MAGAGVPSEPPARRPEQENPDFKSTTFGQLLPSLSGLFVVSLQLRAHPHLPQQRLVLCDLKVVGLIPHKPHLQGIAASSGPWLLSPSSSQEQLIAAANSELPASLRGSYFLEEQQRLQEEQEVFQQQKRAFEEERKNFTEAAIRLGHEVASLCFLFHAKPWGLTFNSLGTTSCASIGMAS